MVTVTELVGLIGTILVVFAYIPQARHIIKEHCAGGVSTRAWAVWLGATILIAVHAFTTKDIVFITLQVVSIAAMIVILILIKVYSVRVCHSREKKLGVKH